MVKTTNQTISAGPQGPQITSAAQGWLSDFGLSSVCHLSGMDKAGASTWLLEEGFKWSWWILYDPALQEYFLYKLFITHSVEFV